MTGSTPAQRDQACFLCQAVGLGVLRSFEPENLLIASSEHSLVILNKFPYSSGHVLVSPKRHLPHIEDLSPEESLDAMQLLQKSTKALKKAFKPDGFNVGINLGQIAGAGVPGHLHMHVVPRWNGDHNFMTVAGNTRVMPMLMDEIWKKLRECWDQ